MSAGEPERLSPQLTGALYLECSQQLLAFAIGLLKDRNLAQEVVQVAFGKVLQQGGKIPAEARRAWLFQVARNEALAIRRRDGVTQRVYDRLSREQLSREGVGESREPHHDLVTAEQARQVRDAIEQLPSAQKYVVEQRIDAGRTFAEIATELQVPLGTVLTRMRLALGKLEQVLKE